MCDTSSKPEILFESTIKVNSSTTRQYRVLREKETDIDLVVAHVGIVHRSSLLHLAVNTVQSV